jgi:hypothetical protein
MPTFLTDPTSIVFIVLGAIVAVLGAIALRARKKGTTIAFATALAILATVVLIDRLNVSPREATVARLNSMSAATKAMNADDLFRHVSANFRYGTMDKKGLQDRFRSAQGFGLTGLEVWDFNRGDFRQFSETLVEQGFAVQPNGYPQFRKYVVGVFQKESDGEWRMTTFRIYNPINRGQEEPMP